MLGRLAVACRGLKVAAPEVQRALAARLSQPLTDIGNVSHRDFAADAATVSRVKELKTDQQFESVLADAAKTNALSVFDFTATWCGPCKMIAPVVDQLSADYDEVTFYKVDIDRETIQESVRNSNVVSVPTFSFYRGGKKIATFAGADRRQLQNNVVNLIALGA